MLCSARELGLSDDASGLLELPAELPTGQPLAEALGLDDVVLGLNLTPNRGDCMSVLGIAREVAALSGAAACTARDSRGRADRGRDRVPVELTAGAGCVRFASRVIRGAESRCPGTRSGCASACDARGCVPSTRWWTSPTTSCSSSVSRCMLMTGVRSTAASSSAARGRARRLRLLDGRDVTMDESVLVIADHCKALGLAGVMGGDRSGIDEQHDRPAARSRLVRAGRHRGTRRRYGLVTDASQRFERGVDPTLQERALERATRLILDSAGGAAGPLEVAELADELPEAAPGASATGARPTGRLGPRSATRRCAVICTALGCECDARVRRPGPSRRHPGDSTSTSKRT